MMCAASSRSWCFRLQTAQASRYACITRTRKAAWWSRWSVSRRAYALVEPELLVVERWVRQIDTGRGSVVELDEDRERRWVVLNDERWPKWAIAAFRHAKEVDER